MLFITQEQDIKYNTKVVALYFYASWMPYHKKMLTMIGKIEEKYKGILFLAIDIEHFKGLCKRFNVTSIPEIIVLVNEKEEKRVNGLILTSALKSVFADIYNSCNQTNGEKYHDRKESPRTSC
jgi:thioredoxin-like negative regulator of GroEL